MGANAKRVLSFWGESILDGATLAAVVAAAFVLWCQTAGAQIPGGGGTTCSGSCSEGNGGCISSAFASEPGCSCPSMAPCSCNGTPK